MNIHSSKKLFAPLLPLFILLIHIPFVFAKAKPDSKQEADYVISGNKIPINASPSFEKKPISNSLLYDSMQLNSLGLSEEAFDYAVKGFNYLRAAGKLENDNILSIVDFSLPSDRKRLFVIDMENYKVLFNTYVAHGKNSGKKYAHKFSNSVESYKSSLGFYITKETYIGEHGFSLQLEGEEKGINDNAYRRSIVIHKADYVNEKLAQKQGYIGRSLGCPALPDKYSKPIIETIKDGSCFFMFSPDPYYLSHSRLLQSAS